MATATERSSISPMTSTSHTMTAFPPAANGHSIKSKTAIQNSNSSPYDALIASLQPENRYTSLTPAKDLNEVAVKCAKDILDGLAGKVYEEQKARLEAEKEERKRKRKRGPDASEGREVLKIRKIVTEGFETSHVWEQTRRVIDALRGEVEREFEGLEDQEASDGGFHTEEDNDSDEDGFGIEDEEENSGEEIEGMGEDSEEESLDEEQLADLEAIEAGSDLDEEMSDLGDEDDIEDEDQDDDDQPAGIYVPDPHGLNDGFFSIDEFNKQTEFLEQQEDPFAGEDSDEEEIDWDADPITTAQPPTSSSNRKKAMDINEEESDEDEEGDGPTFGNADLNAPFSDDDDDDAEEDSDADMDEDPGALGTNTNDILYADFFEPPPRKASKGDRQASYLSRQANKNKATEEDEATTRAAELERAQASQRRDLFDDESIPSDSEASDLDPGDPQSRKSAHERRQAKLLAEIRKLEAASVEKRDWTLAGEAKATDREKNSLTFLEEELEFERTGKPVPVITAEVSESIEELIKRRILNREFDEVIKRRPDSLSTDPVRRGALELSDQKSAKGLGDLYAEDHVKDTAEANGETYVSASDEKVNKQREEVKSLWKDVEGKLDALSSWHYRPRPAAPAITVVSDIATVRMEDAQPSTAAGGGIGGESMLAPQEIYKAGQDLNTANGTNGADGEEGGNGNINRDVIRGGAPVARDEMTREEKLRRRRREKERIRKRGGEVDTSGKGNGQKDGAAGGRKESKKSREKKEVMGQLKKGGVLVINRKGEIRDMEGNKAVEKGNVGGGGSWKL